MIPAVAGTVFELVVPNCNTAFQLWTRGQKTSTAPGGLTFGWDCRCVVSTLPMAYKSSVYYFFTDDELKAELTNRGVKLKLRVAVNTVQVATNAVNDIILKFELSCRCADHHPHNERGCYYGMCGCRRKG